MKLLVVNQHYPPDAGATGRLVAQLARELAAKGHEVTVLTGRPTYDEAKRSRVPDDEFVDGVRVLRLPLLPRWASPIGRTLHYLSFAVSLLVHAVLLPRPDAILSFSATPMFGGVTGLVLARLKKCPFLYGVQDVYPEIAVALGLLRSRVLTSVARFLETRAWRGAAKVILIGEDLLPIARGRGVPPERIEVITNWADPDQIVPMGDSPLREELGISSDEFVVGYAGNFGHSQDFEAVLQAARRVEEQAERPVRFLLVGGGSQEGELQEAARGVPGIVVAPFQPERRIAEVLSAADLSLVPLRPGLSRFCVPSKVYSILASGRPVGAALDEGSEVARIVEQEECGFRVDPNDAESLASEILKLAENPELASQQGRNGRRFGETGGSLRRAVEDYERLLEDITSS